MVSWLLLGAVSLVVAGTDRLGGHAMAGIVAVGAVAIYVVRPLLHRASTSTCDTPAQAPDPTVRSPALATSHLDCTR
jgi:hypothetical protein